MHKHNFFFVKVPFLLFKKTFGFLKLRKDRISDDVIYIFFNGGVSENRVSSLSLSLSTVLRSPLTID